MGVGYYIINCTKKQYFCLGTGSPYSVSAPIRYGIKHYGWSLDDEIVSCDDRDYSWMSRFDDENPEDTGIIVTQMKKPDGWVRDWYPVGENQITLQ